MPAIGRKGDASTGHDACGPVPWSSSLAPTVFADGKAMATKGTQGSNHGCRSHSPHPPVIVGCSGSVFACGKGVARKGDSCGCGDAVKAVSSTTFADG